MRKDWPIRNCEGCGSMITHYSRNGLLLDKCAFLVKQFCNGPCWSSSVSRNNIASAIEPKPKKCRNCSEMISPYYPGGERKGKNKFNKAKFHSRVCYFDSTHKPKPPKPDPIHLSGVIRRINFHPTSAVEMFISAQ